MSKPVTVTIPHRLGREEAVRRLQTGLGRARADYAKLLTLEQETWTGDHLAFRVSALGQSAAGTLDVADDHVRLEVTLPWLLGRFVEKITPVIKKQGTLMLEKK